MGDSAGNLQAGLRKLERGASDLLEKNPRVLPAYVFGSSVTGFDRTGSDVDMAVRVSPDLTPVEIFDLRLKLIDDFEELAGQAVDIVILNTASLRMIRQVMKTGRLIYAADMKMEVAFRLQKRKEYFDFHHYFQDDKNGQISQHRGARLHADRSGGHHRHAREKPRRL